MHVDAARAPPPRDAADGPQIELLLGGRLGQVDTTYSNATQRRRNLNAEARAQASILAYVRTVASGIAIFAVPNGGLRIKAEAARLKWTGLLAGVLDLLPVLPAGRYAFWETETRRWRLGTEQRDFISRLEAAWVRDRPRRRVGGGPP